MRIRLKQDCAYEKMNTPYGLVTKDWKTVNDGTPIYSEMEVDMESIAKTEPVVAVAVEPTIATEPIPSTEPTEDKKKALPAIAAKKKK